MKRRDESIVLDLIRAFPRFAIAIALCVATVLAVLAWVYGPPAYYSARSIWSYGDVPSVKGAPREAVVRVSAPEGETYRIQWGEGLLPPVEPGTIDPTLGYRDHSINPRAVDASGNYVIIIYAGDGSDFPLGEPGTEVGAGLFVFDSYEACKKGEESVTLEGTLGSNEGAEATSRFAQQLECGSYRYFVP